MDVENNLEADIGIHTFQIGPREPLRLLRQVIDIHVGRQGFITKQDFQDL